MRVETSIFVAHNASKFAKHTALDGLELREYRDRILAALRTLRFGAAARSMTAEDDYGAIIADPVQARKVPVYRMSRNDRFEASCCRVPQQ